MAKNDIYKITVTRWHEHNQGSKKTYKKTLIANNIINDAKVMALPTSCRWMFMVLLILCGDHAEDTITISEAQLNLQLGSGIAPAKVLDQLQSFQLITFEKSSLNKEIKKEIKKRIAHDSKKPAGGAVAIAPARGSSTSRLIARYCEEFKRRYGTNPEVLKSDAGRLGRLAKELGEAKALTLVMAYFAMPDAWIVKTRHSVSLLVTKVNEIKVFAETGDFVTMAEVRDADKNMRAVQDQTNLLADPEFAKGFDDPTPQIAGGFE